MSTKRITCFLLILAILCGIAASPVVASTANPLPRFVSFASQNSLLDYSFNLEKEMSIEDINKCINDIYSGYIIDKTFSLDVSTLMGLGALIVSRDKSAEIFEYDAIRPAVDLLLLPDGDEMRKIEEFAASMYSYSKEFATTMGYPCTTASIEERILKRYNEFLSGVYSYSIKSGDAARASEIKEDILKVIKVENHAANTGRLGDRVAVIDIAARGVLKTFCLFFNANALIEKQASFEYLLNSRFPDLTKDTGSPTYEAFKDAAQNGLTYYKKGNWPLKIFTGYYDISEDAAKAAAGFRFSKYVWPYMLYDLSKITPIIGGSTEAVNNLYVMLGTMRIQAIAEQEYKAQMANIQQLTNTNQQVTQAHVDRLYNSGLIYLRTAIQARELMIAAEKAAHKAGEGYDVDFVKAKYDEAYDMLLQWMYMYSIQMGNFNGVKAGSSVQGNTVGNNNNGSWVVDNGDWLYYVDGHGDIYRSSHDGNTYKLIYKAGGITPSRIQVVNNRLYFSSYSIKSDSSQYGFYSMNLDGSDIKYIARQYANDFVVACDRIIYSNESGIYKMNIDGKENAQLVSCAGRRGLRNLNHLGGWIYYTNLDEGGMYKVRIDGGEPVKLTDNMVLGYGFWDKYIYFIYKDYSEPNSYICAMTLDGKNKATVLNTGEDIFAMNMKDECIYYYSGETVTKYNVDSKKSEPVFSVVDLWKLSVVSGGIHYMRSNNMDFTAIPIFDSEIKAGWDVWFY